MPSSAETLMCVISPLEFMQRYRSLRVQVPVLDRTASVSRLAERRVQLRTYFLMSWKAGSDQLSDFQTVTEGSTRDIWYRANRERIQTAAMGKGAPRDYELALEWAVRSGRIAVADEASLQTQLQAYSDDHLGIDCSGFVTNYLCASGVRSYSAATVRNTSAASYFDINRAINDPAQIQQGDLLVWLQGNAVKSNPGHVAVVESYLPQSQVGGNMRVVEATGAGGASPKLLDSMYAVEAIQKPGPACRVMVLTVKRHGVSGSRVAVMRP